MGLYAIVQLLHVIIIIILFVCMYTFLELILSIGAAANELVAYQIPYHDELPTHSSIEDARRVVVEEGKRPITAGWPSNKVWLLL